MPVKVEPTPPLPGLSPVGGKPLVARFDGGRLSSDGGALALREVERGLGIADRLAACLKDPRAPEAASLETERLARTIYRTRDATRPLAISALWRSSAWPVQPKLGIHRTGSRPVVATALFDLLFHYTIVVHIEGASYHPRRYVHQ
jgi:hypothetical protein